MTTTNPTLYLIRGLPGVGKSTLADKLGVNISADDYFHGYDLSKPYVFVPEELGQAHKECQDRCRALLEQGLTVAVANTFTMLWELQFYFDMANELNVHVVVIDLFDGGFTNEQLVKRNTHGVPLEGFERMRGRYQHDLGAYRSS